MHTIVAADAGDLSPHLSGGALLWILMGLIAVIALSAMIWALIRR